MAMRLSSAQVGTIAAVAVVAGAVTLSHTVSGAAADDHMVTQAQFDGWKTELSNWGRWGKDDQKGTMNLITPAKRKSAAALVKEGFAVSLARDANTEKAVDNAQPYEDVMTNVSATGSGDKIAVSFHGYAHTHWDGLAHHFLNGKLYNGYDQKETVTMEGMATKNAVINNKTGIFTRGILMDIPRLKGVPYLEPGTPIFVEDLEAWEKQAGIKVGSGDAVFIRTGRWMRRAQTGPWDVGKLAAGLDPSVLPWIKKRDIAILGSESALSAVPIPKQLTNPDDYLPVHNFVLVALGMNLFDDCDLDALAQAAAARNR
jgi:hypothetical protein